MDPLIFKITVAVLAIILIFILFLIGRKFRQLDVVDTEIHTRALRRRAQELKDLGLITSIYDFMVGVTESKKLKL